MRAATASAGPTARSRSRQERDLLRAAGDGSCVHVGYRYHDELGIPVRFPFGHGLTYTTSRYDGLRLAREGGEVTVRFTIRNTGKVAGTARGERRIRVGQGLGDLRLSGTVGVEP